MQTQTTEDTDSQSEKEEGFISLAELEERVPVCKRSLSNWIRRGEIPSIKIGRRRLFFWPDVKESLRRKSQGGFR